MTRTALILAAGLGTRMRSGRPKLLHTLAGRPMIDLVVRAVRGAAAEPVVVVGSDAAALRAHLGDGIPTVLQSAPRGTGHAVQVALPALPRSGEAFIVYGDTPLLRDATLQALLEAHRAAGAVLTLLTAEVPPPNAYGRIERDAGGRVTGIVETRSNRDAQARTGEANLGAYVVDLDWLHTAAPRLAENASGEVYLTDLAALAAREGRQVATHCLADHREGAGINTRVELGAAEAALRERIRERHMLAGVTLRDPASTFIDDAVEVGEDSVLLPGTILEGRTRVGRGCVIGPRARVSDSVVGDRCVIGESTVDGTTLEDEVSMGPYCHLRPGTHLERGVELGNYVEIKNSRLGAGTKCHHFSYLGDATIGIEVNIGAGTVTANYDQGVKNPTFIGDHAFVGVDTMFVAPVRMGAHAKTGAGAIVTKDVPDGMLAVGVPARAIKRVWPAERAGRSAPAGGKKPERVGRSGEPASGKKKGGS